MSVIGVQDWFKEAVPAPTVKNLHVQMGVHFEEVVEMMETLEMTTDNGELMLLEARGAVAKLAEALKKGTVRIASIHANDMLDSLTDQIVTATGTGHMLKMDVGGALYETNRSNFSKFVDGRAVFDENGKIKKGPDFFKPNLAPYLPIDHTGECVKEMHGVRLY